VIVFKILKVRGKSGSFFKLCFQSATGKEAGSYIQNELEALEREQKQIDEQAAILEKELRRVMESGEFLLPKLVGYGPSLLNLFNMNIWGSFQQATSRNEKNSSCLNGSH